MIVAADTTTMKILPSVLPIGIAAALIGLAGLQQPGLVAIRARQELTPESALDGVPPLVAFSTIVLGGFRGVLADLLWLHATSLQERGRYFDLVQLADWITKLEPRSTGTWEFQAWNMAYNVSAMMTDPAERWQWVQNGIRLLREDGLRYNPRDARLHFVLGWLFQHKLGMRIDPAWLYFQQRLAVEMDAVLPGGFLAGADLAPGSPTAAALARQYGLDPAAMRALDTRFGPLDWRLPESQALYWAQRGLQRGGDPHNALCERMLYQSSTLTFLQGHLDLDPAAGRYERGPRPDLFANVRQVYRDLQAGPNAAATREPYQAFLEHAIEILRAAGRDAEANEARSLLLQARPALAQPPP
ncbi:MAG: hypothetical protein K8T26_14185 [Lentisphaerae bacterium]|nr:hypothetical protein [Lentisphaerota bacterium]